MKPLAISAWVSDLVFPKTCVGCGAEGNFLCPTCCPLLRFQAPTCPVCSRRNFDGIVCGTCSEEIGLRRFLAPFSYREPLVRDLIHTYKYEGVRELAELFAEEIAGFLGFYGLRPNAGALLVPIPLHRSRLRERGFNQSELLASCLGKRLGLVTAAAIRRTRSTEQQIEMDSHKKRRENVENAFAMTPGVTVAGQSAILVDDVSTSGATLGEAARILRKAGARTVWAITIAKG